jgi:hypothetical protein
MRDRDGKVEIKVANPAIGRQVARLSLSLSFSLIVLDSERDDGCV